MRVFRRLAGALACFLGGIGVVACLVGLWGTWLVHARIDAKIANVVARVDVALSTLQERARQATGRIEDTRDSARELNERVQQRMAELRDVPAEEAPDIGEIERQLRARIQLSRDWIGFMQSGADLVEQILQMLNATSLFLQQDSKTGADLVAAVRAGHDEIRAGAELADDVRAHLENIRAHRNVEASAQQIRTLSSRIDASLQKVQGYGEDFESALATAGTAVANLRSRIRKRMLTAAVIVNLVLIWLAVAQASLAIHGGRLLRSRSSK